MTSSDSRLGDSLRSLAGRLVRRVAQPLEGLLGPVDSWIRHRETVSADRSVRDALEALDRRADLSNDGRAGPAPVFVLASSWRAGSTLVQRTITGGGDVLVWGESYARSAYVRRLSESLLPITDEFPPDDFIRSDLRPKALAAAWVANLYPPLEHLVSAHRAFFEELYWTGARDAGYGRWGLKSVHLDGEHARYLHTLFPEGGFVILVRNPFDAYRSYRRWLEWYDRYPERPVFTVTRFGRMWRERTRSLLEVCRQIGGLVVRYEELVTSDKEAVLRRLSEHLGTRIAREALDVDVPARGQPRPKRPRLPWVERVLLEREVGEVASALGYEP